MIAALLQRLLYLIFMQVLKPCRAAGAHRLT